MSSSRADRVIVVGHNVRNVAESARKAGYDVFAITRYVDADLKLYAKTERISDKLKQRVEELAESLNAKVVLCSGCEDIELNAEILGTDPKEAKKITNKLKFYRTLEKAGISFPELTDEPPCILKPTRGGGGQRVALVNELDKIPEGFLAQRYIDGVPCSVSLIAIDRRNDNVKPIAINRMFVGWKEMNADGFLYCGNLTPLIVSKEVRDRLIKTAIEVVELFDVLGSVGVDFILTDEPFVLELNPRFQGSLDSVEWSYDINLFRLHVMAVEGRGFENPKPKGFAGRSILFADRSITIKASLVGNSFFADIPNVGEVIEKGEPVVSILASGIDERDVIGKILARKRLFYRLQE